MQRHSGWHVVRRWPWILKLVCSCNRSQMHVRYAVATDDCHLIPGSEQREACATQLLQTTVLASLELTNWWDRAGCALGWHNSFRKDHWGVHWVCVARVSTEARATASAIIRSHPHRQRPQLPHRPHFLYFWVPRCTLSPHRYYALDSSFQ